MKDFSYEKNIAPILQSPASIAALAGVIILIAALMVIKKVKITPKIAAQVGLALALSLALDMFKIFRMPQGGSITLGSMVPILLISFFYGPELGLLTGFLYGIIDLLLDPYILHPIQVLFDYPLPFMALGLAGYFKNKKLLGTTAAIFVRFLFHFVSGFVFFAEYAQWGLSPVVYSLVYNGSFLAVEGAVCLIIIAVLPIKRLQSIINKNNSL
jgi:thiamine transporter